VQLTHITSYTEIEKVEIKEGTLTFFRSMESSIWAHAKHMPTKTETLHFVELDMDLEVGSL